MGMMKYVAKKSRLIIIFLVVSANAIHVLWPLIFVLIFVYGKGESKVKVVWTNEYPSVSPLKTNE